MNGVSKKQLVNALCRLSATLCAYTKQPCDCKYMQEDDNHIASGSESGSGCPEITMAAVILAHMSEQDFLALTKRSGISIHEDKDLQTPDVFGMIKKFQEQRFENMQLKNIQQVLSKPNRKRPHRSGGPGKKIK